MQNRHLQLSGMVIAAIAALTMSTASASAQGILDFFFGQPRRHAPSTAYSDPYSGFNPFGSQSAPRSRTPAVPSVAYCVRLCDGRYFPIQRTRGVDPATACNSFCPASTTKIFSGSTIDRAVAHDGARYSDLKNAFVYRTRIVVDCTCNGKDPAGLATTHVENDPTLHRGDIVATNDGFVAYTGGRRHSAEFTPVDSYTGLSAVLRERLAGTRIVPGDATAFSPEALHAFDDRRAQLDR